MTRHSGPEFHVPDNERCEALVKGQPSWNFKWMQVDHRCPRRAVQMRGQIAVCHIHGRAKQVAKWGCEMTRDPGPQCDSMRIASDYAPDVWWAGLLPPNFHLNGELNVHTATLMFSACAMMYYAAMERAMDHG